MFFISKFKQNWKTSIYNKRRSPDQFKFLHRISGFILIRNHCSNVYRARQYNNPLPHMKFSFLDHHDLVSRQRHRLSSLNGNSTVYGDIKNLCTFSLKFYDLWWLTNTYNNPTARAPHSNRCHTISKSMCKTLRV